MFEYILVSLIESVLYIFSGFKEIKTENLSSEIIGFYSPLLIIICALFHGAILFYQPLCICHYRANVDDQMFNQYCLTTGFTNEENEVAYKEYQNIWILLIFCSMLSFAPRLFLRNFS